MIVIPHEDCFDSDFPYSEFSWMEIIHLSTTRFCFFTMFINSSTNTAY